MLSERERPAKRPDSSLLRIRLLDEGEGICRVECAGEIDIQTAPRFGEELAKALEKAPCRVIVDLRQVSRIDSVGVRHLLDARAGVAVGSKLEVQATDPRVRMMLEIAGVERERARSIPGVR
ncbi:MAG TPA: STAS domain-containing protein [Armatimonadota bacterium]|nr:STAS domain-containing protein [Armatimonadota bacterium]